ncbi:MAG TPA: hypothetical protein VJ808_04225, partial [Gemmatimonadales bacterium]|nr:hypothetical protein [Gemmatimonadales bacterium]
MSLAASREGFLQAILRKDRLRVGAGLLALVGLAWVYIFHLADLMSNHSAMAMPQARVWNAGETAGLIIMWTVMMIAMMLPSAAPVILL